MKSLMLFAILVLSTTVAFAGGRINTVECAGAPRWVQFQIGLDRTTGTYHGRGMENYLSYKLDCSELTGGQIVCESPELPMVNNKKVSAVISFDQDGIATATYEGAYQKHNHIRIGCIARM